jgi:hypothetical protein
MALATPCTAELLADAVAQAREIAADQPDRGGAVANGGPSRRNNAEALRGGPKLIS